MSKKKSAVGRALIPQSGTATAKSEAPTYIEMAAVQSAKATKKLLQSGCEKMAR